jgi:hypothetical protein
MNMSAAGHSGRLVSWTTHPVGPPKVRPDKRYPRATFSTRYHSVPVSLEATNLLVHTDTKIAGAAAHAMQLYIGTGTLARVPAR